MRTEWIFAGLAIAAVGVAITGCPGELDDESRFRSGGTTCTDAPKDVFAGSCVSGCHSAADAPSSGDLDLETPGMGARMSGKKAKGGAGLLIDPANVDKSVLLTKLKAPPPFGARMPFGSTPLTDDKIKCVRDWIAAQGGSATDAGTTDSGAGADSGADDAKGD